MRVRQIADRQLPGWQYRPQIPTDESELRLTVRGWPGESGKRAISELFGTLEFAPGEIIGPIRQAVLSGAKEPSKFELLKERLRAFPDLEIGMNDYEEAASLHNRCRSKGIQGSFTDFLICTVAIRDNLEIFTADKDFEVYQKILPIRLHRMKSDGK